MKYLKINKCLFILTLFLLAIFITACSDEEMKSIICSSGDKNLAMKVYCLFGNNSSKESSSDKTSDVSDNSSEDTKVECKYDSECSPVCVGDIAYKQGCNPRTGKCEHTFEDNCGAAEGLGFGDYIIKASCIKGECRYDPNVINAKRAELKQEVADLAAARPVLRSMMTKSQVICDSSPENVDFASMAIDIPSEEIQDCCMTNSAYDLKNTQETTSRADFVKYNCELAVDLGYDIGRIDEKTKSINQASSDMYNYAKMIENQ